MYIWCPAPLKEGAMLWTREIVTNVYLVPTSAPLKEGAMLWTSGGWDE